MGTCRGEGVEKIFKDIYIRPLWQIEPPNNLTEDFTK